ncbi:MULTISPECIES: hypothetical protein [Enterococcus]|jgi:hypothetical protein|uniref:Uncharacterized protein n=1 Tax=Enterococcus dispar ATCC 51266 TaxID=1139219 RepID=S1P2V7_9ENTE|nr:hypothetical protein [Enterococcus dispar]EOT40891.1 hypothetical protein OMK_01807 [Enterococcus dispar ATCC 51266]EOW86736.1 hypothetical protein I569_02099 [Enterococcus dispar ATCC 51266]MCU7357650.1 hypothetical protein [Enterococcus dispar]MDT2706343.1 hypothetical protein [Enterococcus dispar]OJG39678.1 hypothetical protein RV01_GL000860 [Enterococcus dispar]
MIRILIILFALLLLFLSYVLLKKPQLLTPLLEQKEDLSFLNTYGQLYLAFGILGFIAAAVNLKIIILFYIFLALVLAALFSLKLAKSLKK